MTGQQRHPAGLRPYAHLSPESGMCLMEYVSTLAGAPFSDNPAGVHPLLASLARAVNDATSDRARSGLLDLAPALLAASSTAPGADAGIELHCLDAICGTSTAGRHTKWWARRRRRAVMRRPAPNPAEAGTVSRWVRLHGPGRRSTEAAVRALSGLSTAEADRALYRLLADCAEAAGAESPPAGGLRRPADSTAALATDGTTP